jgi:hypothetical protein
VTMTAPIFPQQIRNANDFAPDRYHDDKWVLISTSDEESEDVGPDMDQAAAPSEPQEEMEPQTERKP